MPREDILLIQEIKIADKTAFKELYYKYFAALHTYAIKFVNSPEIAEEIVNDLFTAIWNKKLEIDITTSLKSYLYTAIRNRCISKLRQKKVHFQRIDNEDEYFDESKIILPVSQENGLSSLIANEMEDKLMLAIDKLPNRCKEIFMMSRFKGLKQKEIAKEMNLSINTVEKQISRALQKLRDELKPYLPLIILFLLKNIIFCTVVGFIVV